MPARTHIFAETLFDGKNKLENKTIVVEDDRIIDVLDGKIKPDYSGIVTAGFVDAHSHIGMCREGEPGSEEETNDNSHQLQIMNNPIDSIYFDDQAFQDAVDFGCLYSCVVPGSGNLIGGKAKVIRNFAANRRDAVIKDYGFKMALGYNPRSTTSWKGPRPNTRMGVYAMLEKKLDEMILKKDKADYKKIKTEHEAESLLERGQISTKAYEQKLVDAQFDYNISFSKEENTYMELLGGQKTIKVHVHKEDDAMYLIDLVKKYNLKITADHLCDVWHTEVFQAFAEENIPIVYGPLGSLNYKVELKHGLYQNVKYLMESDAFYGFMTDHPVVLSPMLRDNLKYFLIHGMSDTDAISLITGKNAKILGLENEIGFVRNGYRASLVVWDKHPLSLAAYPKMVMAEGKILRDRT